MNKIDVSRIFLDHIRTLKNYTTNRISVGDIALFYGSPLIVAVGAIVLGANIKQAHTANMLTVFSILAGLLLNFLILIYTHFSHQQDEQPNPSNGEVSEDKASAKITGKHKVQRANESRRKTLIKRVMIELYSNTLYSVLVSVLIIGVIMASDFSGSDPSTAVVALLFYLLTHFFLVLLMILKRVYVLFVETLDDTKKEG